MMLYPAVNELVEKTGSIYLLVNATAKRARQIAQQNESSDEPVFEKAVKAAINEIYEDKLIIRPCEGCPEEKQV